MIRFQEACRLCSKFKHANGERRGEAQEQWQFFEQKKHTVLQYKKQSALQDEMIIFFQ